MFFILSKTLYFIVMPVTIITGCFLFSLLIKKTLLKKRAFIIGIILLLFFSNDFLINEILSRWEVPPKPIAELKESYDVAIVLTGITNTLKTPRDRVYFNKGADRIMHTLQLYKLGIVKKILISGGSGGLIDREVTESESLRKILVISGVPESDIFVENKSRNTHENAIYSSEVLKEKYPKGSFLLITSAFHMRRAKACFEKANVPVSIFSTDFYTHDRRFTPDVLILPNVGAITNWTILIRELIGAIMYKIVGYT